MKIPTKVEYRVKEHDIYSIFVIIVNYLEVDMFDRLNGDSAAKSILNSPLRSSMNIQA